MSDKGKSEQQHENTIKFLLLRRMDLRTRLYALERGFMSWEFVITEVLLSD